MMEPDADFKSRSAGVVVELDSEGRRARLMSMLLLVVCMVRVSRRVKSPVTGPEVLVRYMERASMRNGEGAVEVDISSSEDGAEMVIGLRERTGMSCGAKMAREAVSRWKDRRRRLREMWIVDLMNTWGSLMSWVRRTFGGLVIDIPFSL